jgi:DNA-binding transcriptional LysR family regulator
MFLIDIKDSALKIEVEIDFHIHDRGYVVDLDESQWSRKAMSDLIEFRHLKYIIAVAEEGNITKAAERLFVSQPALSKQIKDIEDEIGIPIFIRNREGVELTPPGQMLVAYARDTLSARTEILEMARAVHRGEVPPMRLGFSSFIKSSLLQMFRDSYTRMFPSCEIHLSGGESAHLLSRLGQGTLDAAFLPMPIEETGLIAHQVACDPLVVCMRADDPLARELEISLPVLASKLRIFRDPLSHPLAHSRLVEMLSDVGIKPVLDCFAATPNDIQLMVRSGYGVALVEQSWVVDPELTTRPVARLHWTADTAFVHHRAAAHPALRLAIRLLQKMQTSRLGNETSWQTKSMPVQLDLLA